MKNNYWKYYAVMSLSIMLALISIYIMIKIVFGIAVFPTWVNFIVGFCLGIFSSYIARKIMVYIERREQTRLALSVMIRHEDDDERDEK